jgi:hypothetical protein
MPGGAILEPLQQATRRVDRHCRFRHELLVHPGGSDCSRPQLEQLNSRLRENRPYRSCHSANRVDADKA